MRNTNFDATPYAAGLNPTYDAAQTHFTFLEDNEIQGGHQGMAQHGENLHLTIQNTNHTIVAHYFYNKTTVSWRYNAYQGGGVPPIPYGGHVNANLQALQTKAVEYAWPVGVFVVMQPLAKPAKADRRARQRQAEQAKKLQNEKDMEEFFGKGKSSNSSAKPTKPQSPPGGRVTDVWIKQLIVAKDRLTLEHVYKNVPLSLWEMEAWSTFLDWLTGPDS